MKIVVVIPTLNEEDAIGEVVRGVPRGRVSEIIVVDNGSTDNTASRAAAAGARVIPARARGYGAACLAGAKAARDADVLVFLDGDRSDDPSQLDDIVGPVVTDKADLVIGSRIQGILEKDAMPLHSRLGNRFIVWMLHLLYGIDISDIGSFRAIKARTLHRMNMEQMTYGWPVEMVVKAARMGLRVCCVPIRYRKRIGRSKVSGTLKGTILATYYMFLVPLQYILKKTE